MPHVEHHHYFKSHLNIRLDAGEWLTGVLHKITEQQSKIMALLDDLTAQVTRNADVEKSAVLLLQGLKQKLDEAGTDPSKLKALSDQLAATDDDLAAAIVANTPAAP